MGRLVVIRRRGGVASNYDCCTCPCLCDYVEGSLALNPGSDNLVDGASVQLSATGEFNDCNSGDYFAAARTADWASSNPSAATVLAGGKVTGDGQGSAEITAEDLADCVDWEQGGLSPLGGSSPLNVGCTCQLYADDGAGSAISVQKPSSLAVLSINVLPTGTSGDYGCLPSSNFGIDVDTQYQVLDEAGYPIQSSSMIPHEAGTHADGSQYDNNIGPSRISDTSEYTSSAGTFHDAPLGVCGNGVFYASVTQNITILVGTYSYPVRPQTLTVSSSASGHGCIHNGSDISASR